MRLLLLHPEVAGRSCEDCRLYLYRPDGTRVTRANGKIQCRRPPGQPTPCEDCPKIPKDAPERSSKYAADLDERTWKIYVHYLECKAVGSFPADGWVRRHAALIRAVEDTQVEVRQAELTNTLRLLVGVAGSTGASEKRRMR